MMIIRGYNMSTEKIELITVREDFENIDEYNTLNQKQKDFVWMYAKRKFNDYLMQDYDLCLESCIRDALDRMNEEDLK
jgi:hypothetical protein